MPDTLSNSAVEQFKIEVAACTRLLNNEGILGYSGHVSVRLPDRESLLIQSFDASRNDLTPDDIFVVDLDHKSGEESGIHQFAALDPSGAGFLGFDETPRVITGGPTRVSLG